VFQLQHAIKMRDKIARRNRGCDVIAVIVLHVEPNAQIMLKIAAERERGSIEK